VAELLLGANTKAYQLAESGMKDFPWLVRSLGIPADGEGTLRSKWSSRPGLSRSSTDASPSSTGHTKPLGSGLRAACATTIRSLVFQGTIVALIVVNSALIFVDPGPESDDAAMWVVIDCLFQACYIAELIMKFIVLRLSFFSDGWNCLDFMCVVLGLFGNVISIIVAAGVVSSSAISNEMLLIRLGRVFKLMRLLRLVMLILGVLVAAFWRLAFSVLTAFWRFGVWRFGAFWRFARHGSDGVSAFSVLAFCSHVC